MQILKFKESNQYQKWMFTEHDIKHHYEQKQLVYRKLKLNIRKEDEEKFIAYYINYLNKIIVQTKLPKRVQGTAYTYLKRYFYYKTIYSSNPQQISFICLYLACKVEEIDDNNLTQLSQKIQNDLKQHNLVHYGHEKYRDIELQILKVLNYDLYNDNVFQIIESIIQSLDPDKMGPSEHDQIVKQLTDLAKTSFYQHLIFQFSPGTIALAILKILITHNPGFYDLIKPQLLQSYQKMSFNNIYVEQVEQNLIDLQSVFQIDYHQNVKQVMAKVKEIQKQQSLLHKTQKFQSQTTYEYSQKQIQDKLQQIQLYNEKISNDSITKKVKNE